MDFPWGPLVVILCRDCEAALVICILICWCGATTCGAPRVHRSPRAHAPMAHRCPRVHRSSRPHKSRRSHGFQRTNGSEGPMRLQEPLGPMATPMESHGPSHMIPWVSPWDPRAPCGHGRGVAHGATLVFEGVRRRSATSSPSSSWSSYRSYRGYREICSKIQ